MKVKILETSEIKNLTITNQQGIEWTEDLIEVGSSDSFFYDEEEDLYITSQETFDWWENHIQDIEETESLVEELKENGVDEDAIQEAIDRASHVDREDQPASQREELLNIFAAMEEKK